MSSNPEKHYWWPSKPSSFAYAVKWTLFMLLLIDILFTVTYGIFIFVVLKLGFSEPIDELAPEGISQGAFLWIVSVAEAVATCSNVFIEAIGIWAVIKNSRLITIVFLVVKTATTVSSFVFVYNTPMLWGHFVSDAAVLCVLPTYLYLLYTSPYLKQPKRNGKFLDLDDEDEIVQGDQPKNCSPCILVLST